MTERPGRRGYLDWMRGLAVVIMVGWHTLDAWTTPTDKASGAFWYCQLIGGFGAPIFLFLAGVSVALAAGSRLRKSVRPAGAEPASTIPTPAFARSSVDAGAAASAASAAWRAAWPMVKRGGWIWVLAILFRVQSDVLGGRTTIGQLLVLDIVRGNTQKVDILNVMGPAIAVAAMLWGLARSVGWRFAVSTIAACALACLTPGIRAWTALDALPDGVEGYLRPFAGRTTFSFFPWGGFVFAGTAIGVLLDRTRDVGAERRVIVWFGVGGLALWIGSLIAAHGPSWFGPTDFWRTAPSFFFMRVGVLVTGIAACYLWEARPRLLGAAPFSPMRQLGVTSLFIYWIHVEMAYGGLSRPIKGQLPLPWSLLAFLIFLAAMLVVSVVKTALADRWRARRVS
ncbi:MAG: acyltransferase family protein [Vicinamibacteraceae bacterium]